MTTTAPLRRTRPRGSRWGRYVRPQDRGGDAAAGLAGPVAQAGAVTGAPSARGSRRLATALAIWALAMTAGALVLMVPNSSGTSLEDLGFNGVGGLMLGTIYPILGWLIATRRPENRIGWMFLVIGLSQGASGFVSEYAIYGLIQARPGAVRGHCRVDRGCIGVWVCRDSSSCS